MLIIQCRLVMRIHGAWDWHLQGMDLHNKSPFGTLIPVNYWWRLRGYLCPNAEGVSGHNSPPSKWFGKGFDAKDHWVVADNLHFLMEHEGINEIMNCLWICFIQGALIDHNTHPSKWQGKIRSTEKNWSPEGENWLHYLPVHLETIFFFF